MKNTNNIMIDIETMDNRATAAIVSIGAVRFNSVNGIEECFYTTVCLQSCIDQGLTVGAGTINWWLKQGDDARRDITAGKPNTLQSALHLLKIFVERDTPAIMWGNGSDFDNVILANAFSACGLETPWKFYNNRCYRTLKNMYPHIKMHRVGTHHNALDDATDQAHHLLSIVCKEKLEHLGI